MKTGCLIVNAIVVWNTVYAQLAIDQLRAEGQLITTGELEGISPLQHAHLHAYGEYPIDLGSRPVGYRPLRQPPQREPISQPRSVNRVQRKPDKIAPLLPEALLRSAAIVSDDARGALLRLVEQERDRPVTASRRRAVRILSSSAADALLRPW
jgi:hypothetical protein